LSAALATAGITRSDALAYLGRRLLKLVRHIKGTTFYPVGSLPKNTTGGQIAEQCRHLYPTLSRHFRQLRPVGHGNHRRRLSLDEASL
jgi:hypothetical protein